MLDSYPEPFSTKLAALAVKSRLYTGDRVGATRQLDAIAKRTGGEFEKKPIGQFLRGQVRLAAGNKDEAMGAFRAAADSNDRLYRTRAELALVDLEMENGTLGAADAVARLERLRFAWRGDDLELDILDKLGATYMKAHNYAEGFNTIRQAANCSPKARARPRCCAACLRASWIFIPRMAPPLCRRSKRLGCMTSSRVWRPKDLRPMKSSASLRNGWSRSTCWAVPVTCSRAGVQQASCSGQRQGRQPAGHIRLQDAKPDQAIAALDQSVVPELTPALIADGASCAPALWPI